MTSEGEAVVLFRSSLAEEYELEACKRHFKVITRRCEVAPKQLVIPRYSALPYYQELAEDVAYQGAFLMNSHKQHNYVADMKNWYSDLKDYTPKTWFRLQDLPEEGPFVVKGATNSKKFQWDTHMYAETKRDAGEVYSKLANDGLLGYQDIYFREFVELRNWGKAIGGIPITEEYRFFVFDGKILSGAFYWSEHIDYLIDRHDFFPDVNEVPTDFLYDVISIVSPNIRFFVVDVGRKSDGTWTVIELNDGQMSGLSMNDPDVLYANLRRYL